ncbi:SDR family oxidoreductase [Nocardia abscessus]|nr:SDR family oxidoreductase [Nocardia abscessus]
MQSGRYREVCGSVRVSGRRGTSCAPPSPVRSRRTDALAASRGTGSTPRIVQSTPLGRVGEPDDIAGVVDFLTSDAARWITGASVPAGGGRSELRAVRQDFPAARRSRFSASAGGVSAGMTRSVAWAPFVPIRCIVPGG